MLTGKSSPTEVREFQRLFVDCISSKLPMKKDLVVGFQGGSIETVVNTDGDLWHATNEIGDPETHRFWNAFGFLSGPDAGNIVVEINMCLEGLNRRVGGVFAIDEATQTRFVLHRGSIAGGRPGVGKSAFLSWYRRHNPSSFREVLESNGRETVNILVSEISPDLVVPAIYDFVSRTREFKRTATIGLS
ncbi:MAG TPA: hypothetical protein VJP78_05400 [Thermoleophilia bacterium]|nr:hypothetical protein [Thermoleophilia bacterium]